MWEISMLLILQRRETNSLPSVPLLDVLSTLKIILKIQKNKNKKVIYDEIGSIKKWERNQYNFPEKNGSEWKRNV